MDSEAEETRRRDHDRMPAIIKVSYQSAGALQTDYAQNISQGGLFIATTEPFERGQCLELHLSCAGTRRVIPVPAEVRWVGQQGGQTGIGVQFLLDDPVVRGRVETMVNAVFEPIPPSVTGERLNIILVDPNRHACQMFKEGILSMAKRTFELEDYFVVVDVYDGRSALEMMHTSRFSLAVIELRTPEVDGVELIRRVRTEISQSMPIFAMSRPFPGDKREAIAAGADAFMNKPIQLRALFNTIRAMLSMQNDDLSAA